jgi:cytochrome c oxidase assembly protein subunit 15
MRSFSISPSQYQKITQISLLLLAFIIITGAAVRLSGSGLGCSDWPTCENDQLVAEIDDVHAMVEFVNRVITGFVALAVMIAVLGSLFRVPKRKDLIYLSIGLVIGVIVQIIVGALVVRAHLPPSLVITHFLISMILVWNAVELNHRSRLENKVPKPSPTKILKGITKLCAAFAALVIVTGTIVTGSGPHSGAEKQQILEALENQGEATTISALKLEVERLPFDVPDVARIHGISVMLFLLVTLRLLFMIKQHSPALIAKGQNLMAAIIVQAAIGYFQYFTGVPALLVGVHVEGATLIWVMILRLYLAVHQPILEKHQIEAKNPI